eukprot:3084315-Alexandrium_andersonii.AAC.1
MSASLVGSEMCIRDRYMPYAMPRPHALHVEPPQNEPILLLPRFDQPSGCLLYTSDAADDM